MTDPLKYLGVCMLFGILSNQNTGFWAVIFDVFSGYYFVIFVLHAWVASRRKARE